METDYTVTLGAAIWLCEINHRCAECPHVSERGACGLDGVLADEMPESALCVQMAKKKIERRGGYEQERLQS